MCSTDNSWQAGRPIAVVQEQCSSLMGCTMWDKGRSVPGARKCPMGCGSSGASTRVWGVVGSVDLEAMGGNDAASAGRDRQELGRFGEPVKQRLCCSHPGRLF